MDTLAFMAQLRHDRMFASCYMICLYLNSSSAIGKGGITGLDVTRFRTLLKKTICSKHQRAIANVRTIADTREIEGLSVAIEPMGNSRTHHSVRVLGSQFVTLHC